MTLGAQFFALESTAPKAFDRKAMMRDIYREEKRKARVHLAQLRADLKAARDKRKVALVAARERCRAHRLDVRERLKAHRLQVIADLRATLQAERLAARQECSVDLGKARAIKDEIESSKAKVEAERKYQRQMRHLDRSHRDRLRAHKQTSARERRAESDDLVRGNIDGALVPLFDRIKRQITGSARKTRTEEFLEWCEENPNDVVVILEEENEKKLRELEKEERKAMREMAALAKHEERHRPKRARATAAELAAVPF
ncbi:MAG: hypothetical protein ACHREM_01600 [Polyangiales bacterium]